MEGVPRRPLLSKSVLARISQHCTGRSLSPRERSFIVGFASRATREGESERAAGGREK